MAPSHQPRSESPEASDFLPGLAEIPGPVSITRTRTTVPYAKGSSRSASSLCARNRMGNTLSVACSPYDYLTLTYLFIFDTLLPSHHRT